MRNARKRRGASHGLHGRDSLEQAREDERGGLCSTGLGHDAFAEGGVGKSSSLLRVSLFRDLACVTHSCTSRVERERGQGPECGKANRARQ